MIKQKIYDTVNLIIHFKPSIYFSFKPIKIFEFKELLKGIRISKTDIILDIGSGHGIPAMIIGKKCKKIYGIDISKRAISASKIRANYLKKKVKSEFRWGRLEDIKFKEEFFDKIFSICVLEHISNYIDVLKETYRILKKGGQFIFSVDSLETVNDENLIKFHKEKCYIEKYFKKDELNQILEEIGFKKILIYPIFKTDYAKTLYFKYLHMTKSSNNYKNFFRQLFFIFHYINLKKKEVLSQNDNRGLYLIVKCFK